MDNEFVIAASQAIIKVNNEYWFITHKNRCLYRMNIEEGTVKIETALGRADGSFQFSDITYYKDKLIITPRKADEIYVYNLKTKQKNEIRIDFQKEFIGSKFNSTIQRDNYLYLIPYNYNSIVIFNLETENYEIVSISENDHDNQQYFCWEKAVMVNEYIYIPYKSQKSIIKFDIRTNSYEKILPDNQEIACTGIQLIDNKMWLIPCDAEDGINIWDHHTDEIVKKITLKNFITKNKYWLPAAIFNKSYYNNNALYLSACSIEENMVIDTDTYRISTWNMPYDTQNIPKTSGTYLWRNITIFEYNGRIYFINGINGEWYYFENGDSQQLKIRTDYHNDDMLSIHYHDDLKYLINIVNIANDLNIDIGDIRDNIGTKIYKNING